MKLPEIVRARKGNVITGLMTIAITLAISLLVLANIYTATVGNTAFTNTTPGVSAANTTYAGIWTNAWTAMSLLGILIIVMAAFAIISMTRGGGE